MRSFLPTDWRRNVWALAFVFDGVLARAAAALLAFGARGLRSRPGHS